MSLQKHGVFLDAAAFCPHLKPCDFPGIGLVNALYLEGGIRAVELGSVMFGRPQPGGKGEVPAPRELVRLAFPRRVYTQSHFDYVIEVLDAVWRQRDATLPDQKTSVIFAPLHSAFQSHDRVDVL
jgi:tryptophanase